VGDRAVDLKRIKDLIDVFAATDLGEFGFTEGDCQLRLVRRVPITEQRKGSSSRFGIAESPNPSGLDAVEPIASSAFEVSGSSGVPPSLETTVGAKEVVAPLYGVLHLTPTPSEPPFVKLGDSVRVGQTLCVLEAMKMFHTLKSDYEGIVDAILAASGSEVEAGQLLFRIT
jgi:acetyl-CoA carboxylase biotin carboxyl carrier protein